MLNAGEAGQGFMNVASAAAGRLKGGAGKVSVISSALFGSISGSASANVASTGAITLPAMSKLGYPRSLAAAIEAVASSGGQIMPPLMGAGAFVMVTLTGIPYTSIISAALLPTITPPVCGAVFIAAGMIEENWLKVALKAMALGIGLYIIPLGMIANPALIELDTDVFAALGSFLKMCLGLTLISFGIISIKSISIRLILVTSGLLIIFGHLFIDVLS